MNDLFAAFLESPNRQTYLAVRAAVVASERYDPYSREMDDVDAILDADKLDDARRLLSGAMPNLLLSPAAHLVLSFIAKNSGDGERAQMESFVAATCCRGILATGDGTKDSPYLVVRISDEYDLIQYLGKEFNDQAIIEDGDRHFDRIEFQDGSEIWFDITDAYNRIHESPNAGKRESEDD